jgi:hypothetical protein
LEAITMCALATAPTVVAAPRSFVCTAEIYPAIRPKNQLDRLWQN